MIALAAAATGATTRLREKSVTDPDLRQTIEFCARFGRASNLMFLVIIAVQTVPIFFYLRMS